jgi:hypothetical protein
MSPTKPKTLRDASFIGQAGANIVATRLNDMGYAWHPGNASLDAGIDGYVELRDPINGAALNLMLPLQSKATAQPWAAETPTSFEYTCHERDLVYWLGGSHPVILVVSRPKDDEAYWVSVRDYFKDPHRRAQRKIVFDKRRQRFDRSAQATLMQLAVPRDGGFYTAPLPIAEPIYSNLLQVRALPTTLFTGRAVDANPVVIAARLREAGINDIEWVLRKGQLLTVHDPSARGWRAVVDQGTVEAHPGREWGTLDSSERADDFNDFVNLLGRCLSTRLRALGVRYEPKQHFYFFEATADLTPREISYRSLKHASSRVVFNRYATKRGDTVREWYRHNALAGRFLRYDGVWYLEISPEYHFTEDGRRPLRFPESKRAGIKALERNGTVLGQVAMWADLLTPTVGDLFAQDYPFLTFGALATFSLEAGINEDAWLGNEDRSEIRVADEAWKMLPLFSNEASPYADDAPLPDRPAALDDAVQALRTGAPSSSSDTARPIPGQDEADLTEEQRETLATLASDLVPSAGADANPASAAGPPAPIRTGTRGKGRSGPSRGGARRA